IPVYYALQEYDENKRDKPWGSSDALCSAKPFLNCGFVVSNTDDLYGEETFRILFDSISKGENAAMGYKLKNTLQENNVGNRAIFSVKESFIVSMTETFGLSLGNLEEKGIDENSLCSMNIFALNLEVLELLSTRLKEFKRINENDRKIEAILAVELNKLLIENKLKMRLYPSEDKPIGITNPGDEEIVRRALEN
ncbi:MAG: hypothetical protein NT076_05775, partial [Candidatus Pacearchaeota archaeon]|nr:hypothetical protein [Candidatus Pacearchaeota archaeon]